jgi:protein-serine/threonine kinase
MDLIKKLITDLDHRLGYNGADDIKSHPFFKGIDWNNIKKMDPPFVPDVNGSFK